MNSNEIRDYKPLGKDSSTSIRKSMHIMPQAAIQPNTKSIYAEALQTNNQYFTNYSISSLSTVNKKKEEYDERQQMINIQR